MRLSHSFSVELAEKYGIECAILISHFQFWIEQNQAMGRNYHDGRTWMYQTQKEIAAIYPYWSEDTVQRTIKKLEEHKIIIKGNYNKSSFDRTVWYAFENEEMFTKPRNRGIEKSKSNDPNRGIAPPIPDTNPDTKQDKQQQQRTAAVLPKKSKKELKEPINVNLLYIDIPDAEKRWISQHYDDATIRHAVAWSTHPETKITSTLEQAIKWACKIKPEIPKEKLSVYDELRKIFKHGEKYNNAECILTRQHIAFHRGETNRYVNLDEYFSWQKVEELCHSFQIKFKRM